MEPLSMVEKSEMGKFFGSLTNRTNPLAPGRTAHMDMAAALERIMMGRPPALQHVWDVKFGPHFLPDCDAAPADVRECVASNIAMMAAAGFPDSMGSHTGEYNLLTCEIGRQYHMVYEFIPRYHSIVLYFMRRHDTAYAGPLRAVMPDGSARFEPDYMNAYEEFIDRSYKTDMEKEDLRSTINGLCSTSGMES